MFTSTFDSTICWRGITIPTWHHQDYYCYLIHFDTPYKHAKHYLGSCQDITVRLARHKAGNGARLMSVITQAGISWRLSRLWHCDTLQEAHELERRLKRWSGSGQFCPICQGKPFDDLVFMRQGHQRFAWRMTPGRRRPML